MKAEMKSLHVANTDNSLVTSSTAVLVIMSSNPPSEAPSMRELDDALVGAPTRNGKLIASFLKEVFGPATLRAVKQHL